MGILVTVERAEHRRRDSEHPCPTTARNRRYRGSIRHSEWCQSERWNSLPRASHVDKLCNGRHARRGNVTPSLPQGTTAGQTCANGKRGRWGRYNDPQRLVWVRYAMAEQSRSRVNRRMSTASRSYCAGTGIRVTMRALGSGAGSGCQSPSIEPSSDSRPRAHRLPVKPRQVWRDVCSSCGAFVTVWIGAETKQRHVCGSGGKPRRPAFHACDLMLRPCFPGRGAGAVSVQQSQYRAQH